MWNGNVFILDKTWLTKESNVFAIPDKARDVDAKPNFGWHVAWMDAKPNFELYNIFRLTIYISNTNWTCYAWIQFLIIYYFVGWRVLHFHCYLCDGCFILMCVSVPI